jgi:hypothetical protein
MSRKMCSDLEVRLTNGRIGFLQDLLKGLGRIFFRKHEEGLATEREEIRSEGAEWDQQSDFVYRCHSHTVLMKTKWWCFYHPCHRSFRFSSNRKQVKEATWTWITCHIFRISSNLASRMHHSRIIVLIFSNSSGGLLLALWPYRM